MTRVSSFGHNQSLINGLLQNQSKLFEVQQQINTGKKASEFRGFAREAETLLSARSLKSRTEGYLSALADVKRRLDSNDLQLSAVRTAADNLHEALINTIAQDKALAFTENLDQALTVIVTALNTQVAGNYIFGGSRSDTRPVNINNVADLLAAPSIADVFQNDDKKLSIKVSDGVDVEHGLLASDIATDLLASIRALAEFNVGPDGPLEGQLTDPQRAFLKTEMANLVAATEKLQSYISVNGLRQNRLDALDNDLTANKDFLEIFISDIEDVNLAEAITRANNDQLALEASYSVIGRLTQLSLLNHLPL
jgi:flagellar hook-associated protein 3 FlgL